jgi:hypothetical protein
MGKSAIVPVFVPGKLMAPLAYRDDKILARNLFSHPFFCLTPAEPFFRPDRSSTAPSCRVAVKDGPRFSRPPEGLVLDGRERLTAKVMRLTRGIHCRTNHRHYRSNGLPSFFANFTRGLFRQQLGRDAAFYSAKNEAAAKTKGVKRVCVPNRSTKSAERKREQKKRWFRNGQKCWTGREGRISVTKRRLGLNRCRYRGDSGMKRWVGLGVIADRQTDRTGRTDRTIILARSVADDFTLPRRSSRRGFSILRYTPLYPKT